MSCKRSRRSASAAAATSSRGSGARSSRHRVQSNGYESYERCVERTRRRRRSFSPRPTRLNRTGPRFPGRGAPGLARRGSLGRGSSSSTARPRSMSSAEADRSSRSATPSPGGSARRSLLSLHTSAQAVRSGSRSSASTAIRSSRRTSSGCSWRPVSSPVRAARCCDRNSIGSHDRGKEIVATATNLRA